MEFEAHSRMWVKWRLRAGMKSERVVLRKELGGTAIVRGKRRKRSQWKGLRSGNTEREAIVQCTEDTEGSHLKARKAVHGSKWIVLFRCEHHLALVWCFRKLYKLQTRRDISLVRRRLLVTMQAWP